MINSEKIVLDSKTFTEHVISRKELTIVQFYEEDNVRCQMMDSVFRRLQESFADKIVCFTVLKPEAADIWEKYKIFQSPSYLLIKANKTVEMIIGLTSYDHFVLLIKKFL